MYLDTATEPKVSIRVDLTETQASLLQSLTTRLPARSQEELLEQAYGSFMWAINELLLGRRIVSIDAERLAQVPDYEELPTSKEDSSSVKQYEFLDARPDTNYRQFYLKGRNMRVGQLIYTMRANELTAEEAAEDLEIPVSQIQEAQIYYQLNRTLIEQEADAEKARLTEKGVPLEPRYIP